MPENDTKTNPNNTQPDWWPPREGDVLTEEFYTLANEVETLFGDEDPIYAPLKATGAVAGDQIEWVADDPDLGVKVMSLTEYLEYFDWDPETLPDYRAELGLYGGTELVSRKDA